MKFPALDWPIIFRASLYIGLASLPVLISALAGLVKGEVKIVPYFWWLTWATAAYQALLALRAFFDGSAQRSADARSAKSVDDGTAAAQTANKSTTTP